MKTQKIKKLKQPSVGKLIRELRQELGLTQEELAISLGVTFSTVNRWENGRANPSPVTSNLIEAKLKDLGERGQELLAKHQNI
jgi:transcriptional regulator with XRE-family HTH domain